MFKIIYKKTLLILLLIIPAICFAEYFSYNSTYEVCFTPADDCAQKIIKVISQAKKQILVQAYSFTSKPIAEALIQAKKKGIEVRIILDKSQINLYLVKLFADVGIELTVDCPIGGVAHNKIIIVDNSLVIGGSYNYTVSAAKSNLENVTIISDAKFAQKYVHNWNNRRAKSITVNN